MPETKEQPQKGGQLKKYLDNTFGEEGLRTDVKITLTNETLFKMVAGAVAATGLSAFTYFIIRAMFIRKTN